MTPFAKTAASVGAVMAVQMLALPSMADVTPEDVWQNWQDASAAMGQTLIAASAQRDGDSLVIRNVTLASAKDGVTVQGNLAEIIMQDQGDGTVLVTMSPDYPVKMTMPAFEDGKSDVVMDILVSQQDLTLLASGVPAAVAYDLNAPAMTITLDRAEGPAGQAANMTVTATLSDIAGTYATAAGPDGMTADSDIAIKTLALAVIGADPADQSELRLTAAMQGLALQSSGALMGTMAGAALTPQQMASLTSASKLLIAASEFDVELADINGTTNLKGTAGEGVVSADIAAGVMRYETRQKAVKLTVNAPTIPVPDVAITLDEAGFAATSPLVASDTAQSFAFSTSLRNLTLSDQLWATFDPSAALPRDPINLVIDTEGLAVVKDGADLQGLPADLQSINLKELTLNMAGAELNGTGTSTFTPSADGLPNPSGQFDFNLLGANGLMGKLVDAGFVSAQMLTMPRMMLAMVATPAPDGSDGYTAKIEIRDKAIFANGQMLHQME